MMAAGVTEDRIRSDEIAAMARLQAQAVAVEKAQRIPEQQRPGENEENIRLTRDAQDRMGKLPTIKDIKGGDQKEGMARTRKQVLKRQGKSGDDLGKQIHLRGLGP
jgi:hypothetical protein